MQRKDVRIASKFSPILIIGVFGAVILVVGAAYFLSSSQGGGSELVSETVEEPIEGPGRIISQSGGDITSEAEFRGFENNTLSFVRGDDVLTVEYKQVRGVPLRRVGGTRLFTITPEEIPLGSIVKVYSSIVDGEEVILGVLVE